ncbi:citrate/2-methylcitrate synthase [Bradyrhizobium sp. BRP56]|uniref:citrate/2-methylcitrate synthase n=1 Tax=Bradyrhizobium sp. BRP56 TaxID=2793819 RepID=UPI001CD1B5F0|nr:citrate/2-methylcitrate synthase [Bradyrhizobium sp. BRP56]MCA1396657.1 citrate synthase/methylcitrate synthase [Bradyrhizobium sp. BRP56]
MKIGLDGVVAAETVLSHSDAQLSQLWIRGLPLAAAARDLGYEGIAALLWGGFGDAGLVQERIVADFGSARQRAFKGLGSWLTSIAGATTGEATRRCLAALPDDSTAADIVGSLAVGVPAIIRHRRGLAPVPPDPALSTAADFLTMLAGTAASPDLVGALKTYFAVTAENGLGPSTLAARIVISTGATLAASVLAAYCAFEGPLHGGAPGPALAMIDEAQASGDVEAWLARKLAAGERLAGFGNRAFPNGDPRAALLADAVRRIGGDNARLRFAAEFERLALAALARQRPDKTLQPNLEIYAALLLEACGIPPDAFTPTFATARAVGWLAHAMEQRATGRMLRPTSRYIGPALKS